MASVFSLISKSCCIVGSSPLVICLSILIYRLELEKEMKLSASSTATNEELIVCSWITRCSLRRLEKTFSNFFLVGSSKFVLMFRFGEKLDLLLKAAS